MMVRHFLLILLLLAAAASTVAAESKDVWDPCDFGAKADGKTLDTQAIQQAIDECAESGGGIVRLHQGVFLSGTLRLRSHVTLWIASGAVLRGSLDIADYPSITPKILYLYRDRFTKSLIYAEGQEHIALIGRGEIDGQGHHFPARKGDDGGRPYLIRFSQCKNVQVRGLTLRDSARWLSHYLACEDVTIEGVTINSRIRENRDGMDIDSCDKVRIANCSVFSGDDCIVLKSTAERPCRRVSVTNCTLSSQASALKLGTESQGGFADITFDNCVIYDTGGDGVSVEEVDGGVCERINISNIVMRDVRVPIFVRLGNRANPLPDCPQPGFGSMRDVMITNIQATGADKIGCSITGIPGHPVENVTLQNIRIRFAGEGTAKDAERAVPEKESSYPKGSMFGVLPAYGVYCRHVNGLRLHNLDLAFEQDEVRPAIVADDVQNLDLFSLQARSTANTPSQIRLVNVRGALVHGCRLTEKTGTYLAVTGKESAGIALRGNDLRNADRRVDSTDDVRTNAISTE